MPRIPKYIFDRNIKSSELAVKMHEDYDRWWTEIETLVLEIASQYDVEKDVAAQALAGFVGGPLRWITRYYDIDAGRATMEDFQ